MRKNNITSKRMAMGWAFFVSERPIQVVWSGADEIYTWDIDMYGDMHAHICSDCDQLAIALSLSPSLALLLIPFIHSLEVYVDTYSDKPPYEEDLATF